jgi:aromatic-L-amino-acid/L-tryptophan decarboxylase
MDLFDKPEHSPGIVSLDPDDWAAFRSLSHEVVDDLIDYLSTVRERPAWQSPSPEARAALQQPLPHSGGDLREVYQQVKQHILPYPTGNIHPRFWGWVMGGGTPTGVIADLIASVMNCHVSGYDQAASLVEKQVLAWLTEMLDYPNTASGLLVSGGTAANLIGITVARNTATPAPHKHFTIYASEATHGWLDRSCDLLGLGENALRKIRVDGRDRVDVEEMRQAIRKDRERGLTPLCITGTAGTVATGATDDLNALADLAASEKLWFHIDGAFGALAKLSAKYRHIVDGLERADSVAFDLHKWGYMQYETGAVLIRDTVAHKEAFSFAPSYLETFRGGIGGRPTEFASRGIQLSRSFRALRVWMNLAAYGVDRIGAAIEQNIEDAQYLRRQIEACPALEVLGPAEMNVVCFRYRAADMSETGLDELNRELLVRIQQSGIAVPSSARIHGKFAIRVAHTNHRTVRSDFDVLLKAVVELGETI